MAVNRQITLGSRPVGFPKVSDFRLVYSPLPSPEAGEVLVRSSYLSLDPYVRTRMNGAASGVHAIAIGEVMIGAAVALIEQSENSGFRVGDAVEGMFGWQEYAVAQGRSLRRIDAVNPPMSTALGVLGTPGLTALFGLLDVCHPRRGETVVVSWATGAIGMFAGQIAKIQGCRVVGLADPDIETSWLLDELGFDAVGNSRIVTDLHVELERLCPNGVDVYFDNVGGTVTEEVMRMINARARVVACGQISQDNLELPGVEPRLLGQLILKQAKVEGFQVAGYAGRFPEGLEQLARWLSQGRLRYREQIALGIEAAPQAFIGMLREKSEGKQLVQLSDR